MKELVSRISILQQSITDVAADCIVNAANEGLREGGGVCGAIFQAAGAWELTQACQKIGGCATGNAVITPAFLLPARYIIHAVGPRYQDGKHQEAQLLRSCYASALDLAKAYSCRSIVFPVISAGIYGYPEQEAWEVAIGTCLDYLAQHPEFPVKITFAVLSWKMAVLGEKTLAAFSDKSGKSKKLSVSAEDRVRVFQDTLHWIKTDPNLSASVSAAKKRTRVYFEDDYPLFDAGKTGHEAVTVTRDRTYLAAMRLAAEHPDARIAVLNFANAFHPGGGVATGATAQEESLCRCSTLYPLLDRHTLRETFYQYHKDHGLAKATDSLIYTEGVVICKTDTELPKRMPREQWVTVDVITAAAPDLRDGSNPGMPLTENGTCMSDAEQFGCHVKRAIHILTVAASQGAEILVLGAFGCGAFRNRPEVVAQAYRTALQAFPKVFRLVEFAVYCPGQDTHNFNVFQKALTE